MLTARDLPVTFTAYVAKDCGPSREFLAGNLDLGAVVYIETNPQQALDAGVRAVPYFTAHRGGTLLGAKLGFLNVQDLALWMNLMDSVVPVDG